MSNAIAASKNPLDFLSALASVAADGAKGSPTPPNQGNSNSKGSTSGGNSAGNSAGSAESVGNGGLTEQVVLAAQAQVQAEVEALAFKKATQQANRSVVEALVVLLGNVKLEEVMAFCTPVQTYVQQLVAADRLRTEHTIPPLRTHGQSSEELRGCVSMVRNFNFYSQYYLRIEYACVRYW